MVRGVVSPGTWRSGSWSKTSSPDYAKSQFGMIWDLVDPLVLGFIFYSSCGPGSLPRRHGHALPHLHHLRTAHVCHFVEVRHADGDVGARLQIPADPVETAPEALILSVLFRIGFNCFFRLLVMLFFSPSCRTAQPPRAQAPFRSSAFSNSWRCSRPSSWWGFHRPFLRPAERHLQ